ncbi:MAG TPA: signal peptidase I [Anaerolineae bacterium]|nr:signal peptidase I [Anaerolineae bacterium]
METSVEPPVMPAEPSVQEAELKPHGRSWLREIIETALLTAIIFLFVNAATGRFKIDGTSMEPSLHDSEYVIVDKVTYLIGRPQRGDVVVFARDGDPKDYIKRVIGLPGETVQISDGHVLVNGQVLAEPYVAPANVTYSAQYLGEDEYFVMGDNRGNSTDSRQFGPIQADDIIGRAWIVYWPPTDWSIVSHHTYAASPAP